MAPPKPPSANVIIASATLAKNGIAPGQAPIQPNRPVPPRARPAYSSEAITVNAVTRLGNMIGVGREGVHQLPAVRRCPGSVNW